MPLYAWHITPPDHPVPFSPQGETLDEVTLALPPGLYTTLRTFDGGSKALGLCAHLRRLYHPLPKWGITPQVPLTALPGLLDALTAPLRPQELRLRLVLHLNDGALTVLASPFTPPPEKVYRQGVSVVTVPLARRRPELKRTTFIAESRAQRRAVQSRGAYEGLLVRDGHIWEGLTSNFFYVRAGQVGTAGHGVLRGVTRRAVIHLVRQEGLPLTYAALPVDALPALDEAFLTSSSRGVVPIVCIDGHPVGTGEPGPITRRLQVAYTAFVARRARPFVRWRC